MRKEILQRACGRTKHIVNIKLDIIGKDIGLLIDIQEVHIKINEEKLVLGTLLLHSVACHNITYVFIFQ